MNNYILFFVKQKHAFFLYYFLFIYLLVGFDYVVHLPQMFLWMSYYHNNKTKTY